MNHILRQSRDAFAGALGDTVLWLAALMHLLVAISLAAVLFSVSPALAETPALAQTKACSGDNLLTRLEADDPAAYAKLRAEADQVENGKGIFWKIEKAGVAPSYLLGTMHVTDPRVLAMPAPARDAYAAADTVVVESDEIADAKKASALILSRPDLAMFSDGRTITSLIDKEDADRLAEGLKRRGVSLSAVSRMKPWMIASFVALPACELARKASGASYLDQKLAQDALASGKTLKGLETMLEQIEALNSLPLEPQIEGLIQTALLGDGIEDVIETMSQLYLAGETGMVIPMMRAAVPETTESGAGYADFEQRIIIDRNHRMAERAVPILDGGNAFVAVGALHLPGKEGLVALLQDRGFSLTRAD